MRNTIRAILVILVIPLVIDLAGGQNEKTLPKVRQLTPPKGIFPPLGGGRKILALDTVQELEKLVGAKAAPQLAKQVDFAKERILFVSWSTSGPPFGTLKFEVKAEDKSHVVEFCIQEPKAKVRGEALRLGADYFAVPKVVNGRFRKE